jgi:DNA-binding MltR family transcriptional regulator
MMKQRYSKDEDLEVIYHDIVRGDDRTVAIVAGVYLDNLLEDLITLRMTEHLYEVGLRRHEKVVKVVETLFKPERPLGTAGSKIDMTLALGLIGLVVHNDLTYVNKIRNQFAHYVLLSEDGSPKLNRVTFRSQKIVELCKNLKLIEKVDVKEAPKTTRDRFVITCLFLSLELTGALSHLTKSMDQRKYPKPKPLTL